MIFNSGSSSYLLRNCVDVHVGTGGHSHAGAGRPRGSGRADDAVAAQQLPVFAGVLPDSGLRVGERAAGVRGAREGEAEEGRRAGHAGGGVCDHSGLQPGNESVLYETAEAHVGADVGMEVESED